MVRKPFHAFSPSKFFFFFFFNRQRKKKKEFRLMKKDLILQENIGAYIYGLRIGKNILKSNPLPKMGVMLNFCIVSDRK